MKGAFQKEKFGKTLTTVLFTALSVIYVFPVLMVAINSFKKNTFVKTDTFGIPTGESHAGFDNFINGMTFGGYPFSKSVLYSIIITILGTILILLFTSMAAWYISRVDSLACRIVYYGCVFSMVVPFQMVMFTLSKTADTLKLNTPWTIPVIYLGFGAGLAVFMFVGFVIDTIKIEYACNGHPILAGLMEKADGEVLKTDTQATEIFVGVTHGDCRNACFVG